MHMRIDRKVNLSDIVQKAILLQELSTSGGMHNVSVGPARAKATHPQHAYYRAVVVPLAKAWLNETQGGQDDGEDFDEDSAHNWLKNHLRGKQIVRPSDGEVIGVAAKSHAEYSVKEMIEFVDDVVALLKDCGVNVPPPDRDYREKPSPFIQGLAKVSEALHGSARP